MVRTEQEGRAHAKEHHGRQAPPGKSRFRDDMSIYHIHYELLPVDHPYNRCDIRQLPAPLDRETYLVKLLPQTLWGTLYVEVDGKMLFQRH